MHNAEHITIIRKNHKEMGLANYFCNMLEAFAPIVDKNSRILILGTMPGERSLQLQQYYGHSGNHFWKILFALFNQPFSIDYNERINLLKENNIALWDVLSHCERTGSSDSAINNEIANDFKLFYKKHPKISAVFLDSLTAEKLYIKHVGKSPDKRYYLLPSPSGQHARLSLQDKIERWRVIMDELK